MLCFGQQDSTIHVAQKYAHIFLALKANAVGKYCEEISE